MGVFGAGLVGVSVSWKAVNAVRDIHQFGGRRRGEVRNAERTLELALFGPCSLAWPNLDHFKGCFIILTLLSSQVECCNTSRALLDGIAVRSCSRWGRGEALKLGSWRGSSRRCFWWSGCGFGCKMVRGERVERWGQRSARTADEGFSTYVETIWASSCCSLPCQTPPRPLPAPPWSA